VGHDRRDVQSLPRSIVVEERRCIHSFDCATMRLRISLTPSTTSSGTKKSIDRVRLIVSSSRRISGTYRSAYQAINMPTKIVCATITVAPSDAYSGATSSKSAGTYDEGPLHHL
jgi:hypothetical protein